MSGENILYKNILKEDDEGSMTIFVDKILDFDRMERIAYVKEIEKNLDGKRYGSVIMVVFLYTAQNFTGLLQETCQIHQVVTSLFKFRLDTTCSKPVVNTF